MVEISRPDSQFLLAAILGTDLAYGIKQIEQHEAAGLASKFLDPFPSNSRYYTNGTLGWRGNDSPVPGIPPGVWWSLLSRLEESDRWVIFDTGIVVLDWERIGILWIADSE